MKLGSKGKFSLKGIHLVLVCAWIGAGISMVLLGLMKNTLHNGDELYAFNHAIKLLDDFIVIPAAMGTLLTGLLFSLFTTWGFFKFRWVIFKWIMTVGQILFGTFWLGPWTNGSESITNLERINALHNPTYLHFSQMNNYFGALQVSLLILVVFISVFKPWGKRKSAG